ncbi:NlpC/P60 family protein [Bradyrhizobium sp. YR681]|uniref:NlpC/P60 family protein n=1 Tax=Bradyrhizobium sp. YR681 TaxID=1144344 RepID=UPI0005638437|nr:NlpC/P60 family protein [Bradyrhizobium sp. YR681]
MRGLSRREFAFQRALTRLVGAPYRFGGRSRAGIDCSSLIVRGIRETLRVNVAKLPWMTADQLGKGYRGITQATHDPDSGCRCTLAFFDWDEDSIYEHAAIRLLDNSWMWASSSVGKVVRIDPSSEVIWRRQWREIEGALDGKRSALRVVDWSAVQAF